MGSLERPITCLPTLPPLPGTVPVGGAILQSRQIRVANNSSSAHVYQTVLIMAVLHGVLGICLLFTVVLVDDIKGNSMTASSPAVIANGSATQNHSPVVPKNGSSSMVVNKTATMTIKPLHTKTFTPSHMTFTPSHNVTVTSHYSMTVIPSHNMTVTPSHNMTVTPSHNMTVKPSHNMTVTPSHNMTVTPSQNMTVTPSPTMSTHPVTPTPAPTSTPIPPKPGNFNVTNNTVCLFAYMAASFVVISKRTVTVYNLPVDATATGACANYPSNNKSFITLSWQAKSISFNFTMHFVIVKGKNLQVTSSLRWAAANLVFSMKGPGLSETFRSKTEPLNEVSAPLGHAYLCKAILKAIKLTAGNFSVDVSLMDVKFQPFEVENGKFSKNVDECFSTSAPATTNPSHKESHTVAIAVGCTLAGLVVIVAIGYLIGKRYRRNASAGYRKL